MSIHAEIPTTDEIVHTVTRIVAEVLSVEAAQLRTDRDLREAGADSVKVLRLIARIEREYDIELEDSDVFGVSSIDDIATVVRSGLEAR